MDRELNLNEKNSSTWKKAMKTVLGIGAVILALWGLRNFLQSTEEADKLIMATVEMGNIDNMLMATGSVVPARELEINAPVITEIEKVHLRSGTEVKEGQVIMELDPEYTRLEFEKQNDELQLKRNNIGKLMLLFDKDLRDLDYKDQIKALELTEQSAQVRNQKRLLEVGGATAEELEKAELKLKIGNLEKKLLESDLTYRKKVNGTEKENLELEFRIQEKRLTELKRKLNETKVTAPMAGVLTWLNEDIGHTVAAGQLLARIADISQYRIEARCSDRNAEQISVGMKARIRVGEKYLNGSVSSVSPSVENNAVQFLVALDEPNTKSLRPNQKVEVHLITDSRSNVVRVKNGPGVSGGTHLDVFVVSDNGKKAVKRSVKRGLINTDFIEITDGLQPGEKVIISDTKAVIHLDEFTIDK